MYIDKYSKEITNKLKKIKKKDSKRYQIVRNKIDKILVNPQHKYKYLHDDMKGINRVHLGPFVLIFTINHVNKVISFEDFDHHDKIYSKK